MKTLKQKQAEYLERVRLHGGDTTFYPAPCCGAILEDRIGMDDEVWDTLATCPECEAMYFKFTVGGRVLGEVLP